MNLGRETEKIEFKKSTSELRRAFLQPAADDAPWDSRVSARPLGDVDERELRAFVARGVECGRIVEPYTDAADTLERLSLLRDGRLTNAASVLFCPSERVELKMGLLANRARTEILDLHQETGTVFELVRKARNYILNNTRRRFVISGAGPREEVPELPEEAVREVLVNAYAHRDWTAEACVQIDIYYDSVEIFSPGWFIDGQTPEDHLLGRSRSSLTRNPLIARTLYRSRDIEAYGTGIPRIRDLCEAAGIAFEYVRMADGVNFVFHRNDAFARRPGDGRESRAEAGAKEGGPAGQFASNRAGMPAICQQSGGHASNLPAIDGAPRQSDGDRQVCELLAQAGPMGPAAISSATGVKRRTLSNVLRRLEEQGRVRHSGNSVARTYELR
jgi:ATP-dependent DNA helicase RecG